MSEKQLQSAIVECAKLLGWLVYHTHDSRRSEPGFPDLCLLRGTRIIFAELKTERGELSEAQLSWLEALELARLDWFVWRPANWLSGDVEAVLR